LGLRFSVGLEKALAQIGALWSHVDSFFVLVEEVSGKANVKPLFDIEVLV